MQTFYDTHIHTLHSPDSIQPLDEICETAIERGLRGITITDHAELWHLDEQRQQNHTGGICGGHQDITPLHRISWRGTASHNGPFPHGYGKCMPLSAPDRQSD